MLIGHKKEKCLEIFRNSSEIREMIINREINTNALDLTKIIEMLYQQKNFLNCKSFFIFLLFILVLGDILVKRPTTTKLEKFFAA